MLGDIEVEDVCMEFIKAKTRGLPGKRILVIGAGAAGRGAIERCVKTGARCAWCYHVRRPDARFPRTGCVELFPIGELNERLAGVDVVICAAASEKPVLGGEHAGFFRKTGRVLVIDLGAPRNVDPGLSKSNGRIRVVNLDGLKQWHNRDSAAAAEIRRAASAAVAGHKVMYEKIVCSIKGGFQAEQAGADADT